MDQERAEHPVAPLRDPSQTGLAAARVLIGDQPQPGGQVPAVLEERNARKRGHQRHGRHRSDPRNAGKPLAHRMRPVHPEDPFVEERDPLLDRCELVRKGLEQFFGKRRQSRVLRIQQPGQSRGGLRNIPGKHDPQLSAGMIYVT